MEYIRISAKTVDDAITEASIQLGTSSDNIEYEVVEKGSTGFLGFGSSRLRTRCGESSFTVCICKGSSLHVMKYCAFFITTPIFLNS